MATTPSPYGLVPVRKADGTPYAGARDAFPIKAASHDFNIGYGSVVFLNAGYVELSQDDGSANNANNFGGATNVGALGVFVGCEYVNSEGQLIFSQYFPANTANATAFVVTDPGVTFQAQSAAAVTQADLGRNCHFTTQPTSAKTNTTTGKSIMDVTDPETTDCAFKVVGFSTRAGQSAIGDAKTDVLVKFNPNYHAFANATVAV